MTTIFRSTLNDNFTCFPNALLRDKRMSFRARGVLAMILSNRGDWEVTKTWLQGCGTEGREAITATLKELEGFGYAVNLRIRDAATGCFVKSIWTFHDSPVPSDVRSGYYTEMPPQYGLPQSGNPDDGFPSVKKEQLSEKNKKEEKEDSPLLNEFLMAWNKIEGVSKARSITNRRKTHFLKRAKESEFAENWKDALFKVSQSPFCRGINDRGWVADIDWFIRPDTITKIMEGKYDDKSKIPQSKKPSQPTFPLPQYLEWLEAQDYGDRKKPEWRNPLDAPPSLLSDFQDYLNGR